jgi:ABC transport system ATP-binding/permease protein
MMTSTPTTIVSNPYIELNNQGKILRFELTQERQRLGRDRGQCDLVIPDDWAVISGCHAVLQRTGSDYQIVDGDGQKPSTNGLFLDRTRVTPSEALTLKSGMQLRIGQNPKSQILLTYRNPAIAETKFSSQSQRRIALKDQPIVIGRDVGADLCLESPVISRRHAVIVSRSGQGHILEDCRTTLSMGN